MNRGILVPKTFPGGRLVPSTTPGESIVFGEFEAKLGSRELYRNGARVRLPDQSFAVLAMLLVRPGELVGREDIRQRLWSDDTFVDFDHGLNNAVNRLREALGDSADSPRFVETLPRRGYRFIGPVQLRNWHSVPDPEPALALDGTSGRGRWNWMTVAAVSGVLLVSILGIDAVRVQGRAKTSHFGALAVLPLENVSGDTAQDYFADGMTDTLITDLAELRSVRVISRTSAMHYKGSHKPLPEIAQELNVDAIVEGTVSRAGNRVRINAQLIDARKEGHIWAAAYERDVQDVLELQDDLASSIAVEVAGKLSPEEKLHFNARRRRVNPQAYEAYLKGEYFLEKWTAEAFERAKSHFEESIALDPNYPDAYAGLAEYYVTIAFMNLSYPHDAWLKAEDLLAKTLEMDDGSSKAHSLLGMVKMQFRCDPPAAEKELNRALDLNPADMRALDYHSYYLLQTGHTDQAIAEKKRILEHDPLRVITNAELGNYLLDAGRTDEAIEQLQRTLELDPEYAAAHMRLGLAYVGKSQYERAVAEFQKAIALDRKPARLVHLGDVYARWGKRKEAVETIAQLNQMSRERYVSPTGRALIYARLGNNDAAMNLLEKASPEDEPRISDPGFDGLHADARFKLLEIRLAPNASCPAF